MWWWHGAERSLSLEVAFGAVVMLLFSFNESHERRDLHSFPTRRSSDLVSAKQATTTTTWLLPLIARLPPFYPQHRKGDEDRKSTRLNSSHITTSYAVFCLKKKIEIYAFTTIYQ